MKYNFDKVHNRKNTNSVKWDLLGHVYGDEDLIPLWIADMDFPVAEEIKIAIKKRADHPFYGYSVPSRTLVSVVKERLKNKFNWDVEDNWIVFTQGVIPALHFGIKSLTSPGDRVILQEPCYHQFFPPVKSNGCHVATNPLKLVDGKYEMDFDHLESLFDEQSPHDHFQKSIKAIILCNPHNPTGRVWNRNEITRLGEIAIENDLVVIADEIHGELLFEGNKHVSFGSISPEFEQNSIVLISPSKTFNLPGLNISVTVIANEKLRNNFIESQAGFGVPNIFAYEAFEAAFAHGDEWLDEVLKYLQGNLDHIGFFYII